MKLEDFLSNATNEVEEGWSLVESAEEYLSKMDLEQSIEELEDIKQKIDALNSRVELHSIKLQEATYLYNKIGAHNKRLQTSMALYIRLKEVFKAAGDNITFVDKQKLQWKTISTEYDLALKAIKFNSSSQFEIVLGKMVKHVSEFKIMLKQEKDAENILRDMIMQEIVLLQSDPMYAHIFSDDEVELIEHVAHELELEQDSNTAGANLKYIKSDLDFINVKLFRRKNQLNILNKFDSLIRSRSSTGNNRFYVVPELDQIKDIEDFDQFYNRSIRAVNR